MATPTMRVRDEPAKLHPTNGYLTTRSTYAMHSELTSRQSRTFGFNTEHQKIQDETRRSYDFARIQSERRKGYSTREYSYQDRNPDRRRSDHELYFQDRRQEHRTFTDRRWCDRAPYQNRRQERYWNPRRLEKRVSSYDSFDDERKRVEQLPKKQKELILLKSAPPVEIEQASDEEIFIASSLVVKPKYVKIETEEERAQRLKEEAERAKNLAKKQYAERLRIYNRQQRVELEQQKQEDEEKKLRQREEHIQHKKELKETRRQKKQMKYTSLLEREAELSKVDPSSLELQEIRKRIAELESGFRLMKSLEV